MRSPGAIPLSPRGSVESISDGTWSPTPSTRSAAGRSMQTPRPGFLTQRLKRGTRPGRLDGPRARCIWLRHGEADSTLLLTFHHVISDGKSGVLVMRDLIRLLADPSLELPEIPTATLESFFPPPYRPSQKLGQGLWASDPRHASDSRKRSCRARAPRRLKSERSVLSPCALPKRRRPRFAPTLDARDTRCTGC